MKVRAAIGVAELEGDLSDDQSKEIFAHFGLAVHASNVVECALLNALFTIEVVVKIRSYPDKASWEAAYDHFFETGFTQTFGKLVKRIQDSRKYSDDLISLLDTCKVIRNDLVHRFQRENAEAIYSDSGRAGLIRSYENAVALFGAANEQIEREVLDRYAEMGIDPCWLIQRTEEAMRELVAGTLSI